MVHPAIRARDRMVLESLGQLQNKLNHFEHAKQPLQSDLLEVKFP